MDDSAIDRAIDETARAMTAGEPGGAFRAQVMERLEERPAVRRPMGIVWSTVAAAAIALAVLVGRGRPSLAPVAPSQAARVDLSARPLPMVTALPARAAAAVRFQSGPGNLEEAQQSVRPAGDSDLAALAPSRLDVPSLVLTVMPPGDSIQVQELETIQPIMVTPIGEPQGERR